MVVVYSVVESKVEIICKKGSVVWLTKGNPQGRILVIQDSPTKFGDHSDVSEGVSFTGPPGWLLRDWIQDAGIDLSDVLFGTWSTNADFVVALDEFPNIEVVVPLGPKTTEMLLPGHPAHAKIRGSVYANSLYGVHGINVIPSLHPAGVYFKREDEYRCRADWRKIRSLLGNGLFTAPERDHNISPDIPDIENFFESLRHDDVVSLDIETWGGSIKCVGFARSGRTSIVIPTEKHYWVKRTGIESDLETAWDCIRDICQHPAAKVMQNGLFDAWWLEEYGIRTENYVWDTLAMHHCLWPRDRHALDYLASVYTLQPYWKDEAKEADEIVKVAKQGMDKLYVYNGLDVTVTWEIYQALHLELEQAGMLDLYKAHYADMLEPLLGLMRTGVRVNAEEMKRYRKELLDEARELRDKAGELAGRPLFIFDKTQCERDMLSAYAEIKDEDVLQRGLKEQGHKQETIDKKLTELQDKGISDTVLTEVLQEWKLPKSATGLTESGRMKADNISLRKVQKYYEDRKKQSDIGQKVIELVNITLDHRRKRKLASFLTDSKIDGDNRLRCTYKFTTKTGRLASSKNPLGTGMNLQNIDRALRHLFVPSPGRVMLEVDLSQAEARIVGALTGDEEMIRVARRRPNEGDAHTENAQMIYSHLYQKEVAFEEVTKEMRYLGKRAVHASSYGMRGNKLADILMKEGYAFTAKECQDLIDAYMKARPAIRNWQSDTRKIILRDRYLQTSWGRSVDFLYDRMDDNTYRFAYAYVPQSEIGDLTNQLMVKPVHRAIKENKLKSQLVMQVHDAIVIDCVPEEAWLLMRWIKRNVEIPRIYGQSYGREVELVVPCEYSLDDHWGHAKEWKELPTKEEVAEACKELLKNE